MLTKNELPTEPGQALITLQNITKNYGSFRALSDVTLDIGPGITGLLGPNGAGKSTLIKVLLGLVAVSEGSGQVLGFPLGQQSRRIRALVGYMPEDDSYISGLSGVEMVRFVACLSGIPSVEALRRAHEILDYCGVEQERYRMVETYSTGMRQKLKFAQAIVHDPPLLILDEPTAGLDPRERQIMLQRILSLATEAGKTILLSTHILPDVQRTCDSVVILAKGRVRVSQSLEDLRRPSSPSVHVRIYGDSAKFIQRLHAEGFRCHLDKDGSLTVMGVDYSHPEVIWRCAYDTDVGIRALRPAQNSLEKIFVEAVKEVSRADT